MASQHQSIRVVVAGDAGTGKSSLIVACATESFPDRAPPVLPPTRLPQDFYPDKTPLVLVDTSSRKEDATQVESELERADAIVLTYACDRPATLDSLSRYWLPLLRRLQVKAPVVVVGCRLDARDERQPSLETAMAPVMHEFREIETCIECSALKHIQVAEVFYYAQKAVLHPMAPLFDQQTQTLRPLCVKALHRIFVLCDRDRDGVLSDAELNAFQVQCFSAPLQPTELQGVKRVVAEKVPEGVNPRGLTLMGFLYLHALFIERGRLETTWTVLRTFGYTDELELRPDLLPDQLSKRAPDQSVELAEKGVEFVRTLFSTHDLDQDGLLSSVELESVFETAPKNPWAEIPYLGAAPTTQSGSLTLHSFLALWEMLTVREPERAAAHLIYAGLSPPDASAGLRTTRRRRAERKRGKSGREVVHCLMLGPRGAGKSALLDSLLGRPHNDAQQPTTTDRWAVNVVGDQAPTGAGRQEGQGGAVLLVREVSEDALPKLLADPEGLAPFDCAAFVYDSSSMESWERCAALLERVAGVAESQAYEMPCVLVAAKDDLPPHPAIFPHSAKICAEMGVQAPVPVSARLGDAAELWSRCTATAARPNRSIPETSSARSSKAIRRIMLRSVAIATVGTVVLVGAIVVYRSYHRHSSS